MNAIVRRGWLAAVAAAFLAIPASAHAETVPPATQPDSVAAPAPAPAPGPTVAAAAVAVSARHDASTAAAAQQRAGLGQPRAMMFVGLATFIAGALIGGDAGTIIMIGGAGIGLYGLYQYLQ